MVHPERITVLKESNSQNKGPVVYWMSRDQRVQHNWAFLFSLQLANDSKRPLTVAFALTQSYPNANARHYHFLVEGLKEVERELRNLGISFYLLMGEPTDTIPTFINEVEAFALVSDFDPLIIKLNWKHKLNQSILISHFEVDAHNIVPCRVASTKLEFAAYTIRPKIKKLLPKFLGKFPEMSSILSKSKSEKVDLNSVWHWLNPSPLVPPVSWLKPGSAAANAELSSFITNKLAGYSENRNNPLLDGQSNLSPYLHFGQISAQQVALEVLKSNAPEVDKSAFLEELIVRRELSDNFCYYSPEYDSTSSFHNWAQQTHNAHRNDEREYIYSLEQFENSKTHDQLWNAAQMEMVVNGKMHGFMRMYWAKKILEWTRTSEEAMQFAIYLNDKYSLDGRDPNGYAGIAWSIGGVHDRAWNERPVFGKIRYMNFNGCKRKFNVDGYIKMVSELKV
jgi:deoxyribodipyrimidine photo-lyase